MNVSEILAIIIYIRQGLELFAMKSNPYMSLENVIAGKTLYRGKRYIGENVVSGKTLYRGKRCIGENAISGKTLYRAKRCIGQTLYRAKRCIGKNVISGETIYRTKRCIRSVFRRINCVGKIERLVTPTYLRTLFDNLYMLF